MTSFPVCKSCRRAMQFSKLDSSEGFMGLGGLRFSLSLIVSELWRHQWRHHERCGLHPGREPRSVAASWCVSWLYKRIKRKSHSQMLICNEFALKMPIYAPNGGFSGILPLNEEQLHREPKGNLLVQKHVIQRTLRSSTRVAQLTLLPNTRNLCFAMG